MSKEAALQKEVNTLQSRLNQVNADILALEKQIQELISAIAALESKLKTMNANNTQLQAQLQSSKDALENARNKNQTLRDTKASLEEQIRQKNAEIAALKSSVERLTNELNIRDKKIQEMAAQISDLQKQVQKKTSELNIAKDTLMKKEQLILDLQKSNTEIQTQISKATENFRTHVNITDEMKADYEFQIKNLIQKIGGTQTEIQKVSEEIRELRLYIKTVEQQTQVLQTQVDTLTKERVHLKTLYDQMILDHQLSTKTIESLKQIAAAEVKGFEHVKRQLAAQINDISKQYNDASDTIKELESELHNLSTRCPVIPNGKFVFDKSTKMRYYSDKGRLRPVSDAIYASFGMPETTSYETLELCEKGPDMVPMIERDIYAIIDGATWMEKGELKTLRVNPNDNSLSFAPYVKDVTSAWILTDDWSIRSLFKSGPYLNDNECTTPVVSDTKSWWSMEQLDSPMQYNVQSHCKKYLRSMNNGVVMSDVKQKDGFFLISIGKARIAAD